MASKMCSNNIVRLPISVTFDKADLDSESEEDLDIPVKISSKGKSIKPRKINLASSLKSGYENKTIYIDVNPTQQKGDSSSALDEQRTRAIAKELVKPDKLMEKSVIKPGFEKLESVPSYDEGIRKQKADRRKEADKTKGDKWFNLPATEMTEEKLRDLQIIQMRSILNPKQFYKKNDLKVVPKYFQVGTVVDSAADFYHNRIPRKDRKKTLVDELMADANFQRYNKRKYADIIQSKPVVSGALNHSKRLKRRKK